MFLLSLSSPSLILSSQSINEIVQRFIITCFVLIIYDGTIKSGQSFHIDVVQENSLKFRGKNITGENLHQFLEAHEKILLFGKKQHSPSDFSRYSLVNVKHHKRRRRRRRRNVQTDTTNGQNKIVNFNFNNNNNTVENLNLKFNKSSKLFDDSFVYIKRYENNSQLIDNFDKLINQYNDCFYRNEYSALDICEGNIRGIVRHNYKIYFIHPLPLRFGKAAHIIVQLNDPQSFYNDENTIPKQQNHQHHSQMHHHRTSNDPVCMLEMNKSLLPEINEKNYHLNLIENVYKSFLNNSKDITINNNKNNNNIFVTSDNYDNFNSGTTTVNENDTKSILINYRKKRAITSTNKVPRVLHIETAIFVDKDLYRHMSKNYPKDTESKLIRFVLAMINGVQLLYHHPSLGHEINFVLKRLEILHNDPKGLRRSSDIDIFLNSFCLWQRKFNPVSDADSVHFDHAVILTGLDLYVVSKNGKISSQVVGLAPVAGMCTATSSCTINEGKHFESVFVVAHEIGHNLGMRHDTSENNCDPSLYIMSPTLGSGKITWSKCSRDYLKSFLETHQAKCLFDRGHFSSTLDHAAEGLLPGERFDADQQCLLKYGKNSVRSSTQELSEICRDLHCERDRYTWTSHPSLEGTYCGLDMWCKSGACVSKTKNINEENITPPIFKQRVPIGGTSTSSANFIQSHPHSLERMKYENLKSEFNVNSVSLWSDWSSPGECESGCLYGESGRLREGSTGLRIFTRTCLDYRLSRKKCADHDRKYEACSSRQCYNVPRTTVLDFANQICDRAKKFDKDILNEGVQEVSQDHHDSCKVFCRTKSGSTKTKNWTFPDGTRCQNKNSDIDDTMYCVNGKCQKFLCGNSSNNFFIADSLYCPYTENDTSFDQEIDRNFKSLNIQNTSPTTAPQQPLLSITSRPPLLPTRLPAAPPSNVDNESSIIKFHQNERIDRNVPSIHHSQQSSSAGFHSLSSSKNDNSAYDNKWRFKGYDRVKDHKTQQYRLATPSAELALSLPINKWTIKSGCHFGCMEYSKGIQIIESTYDQSTNIQLCEPEIIACDKLQSVTNFANKLCYKYQLKVRGLSGDGMQILPSVEDPDRGCKVACQDEYLRHRFYLVNGEQGFFPFGTKCSRTDNRYCVNGKCLEFGLDNIPLNESYISLALYRNKRDLKYQIMQANSVASVKTVADTYQNRRQRIKRNFLYYSPINITERINNQWLQSIIDNFGFPTQYQFNDMPILEEQIDFQNPVHITLDDYI